MKTGIELIAEERTRQIEVEGWTLAHDNEHKSHDLAFAARCYAYPIFDGDPRVSTPVGWPKGWPWKPSYPYRTERGLHNSRQREARIRDLVKSGALIAAEIERIQRLAASDTGKQVSK